MFYLAESVNENDVSALPKVAKSMSQAVAKEGSSTDVIDTAEVYEETVRKKSPKAIYLAVEELEAETKCNTDVGCYSEKFSSTIPGKKKI